MWSDCGGGFECSTLTVPRDWAAPDGAMIDIAVIRMPGTLGAHRQSLLVSWGGPGAPRLTNLRNSGAVFQAKTGGRLDIVSWDPRGLNESAPIHCPEGNAGYYDADFQFVNCLDWYDRPTVDQVAALIADVEPSSPRLGAFAVAFSYMNGTACPNPPVGAPVPRSTALPPILVVAGTIDAETPFPWGQELSAALPGSQLLVSQEWGHTAFYTSSCVADLAGGFLVSGRLPPPQTVCPETPFGSAVLSRPLPVD